MTIIDNVFPVDVNLAEGMHQFQQERFRVNWWQPPRRDRSQ